MTREEAIAYWEDPFPLSSSLSLERRLELHDKALSMAIDALKAQIATDTNVGDKYEYHYDHTDCIWYRPEARNRCPVTCAQYRDGWNDAMNYIFRDGKGYKPYRRDKKYERSD